MAGASLSRRRLLGLAGAGLLVPRGPAWGATTERRFLFVYCRGGWDPTAVLLPKQGDPGFDTEADAQARTVGDLAYTDHPERPSVARFFEAHGARCCILNGFEVRSVTHERCRQLLLAPSADDDWAAVLAAHARTAPLLPHVVLSGPAYTAQWTDQVVRVGSQGQLTELLDGTAFWASDLPVQLPPQALLDPVDAYVRQLASDASAAAADARAQTLADGYGTSLDVLAALQDRGGLHLTPQTAGCMRDLAADCSAALDLFSQGLARTAMVEFNGWCDQSWDTHQDNAQQSLHWETLFDGLDQAVADLDRRVGSTGAPLADEVVLVVISEMGRAPRLNSLAGKDHWTFTSALVMGPGVRGGQVIGDLDTEGIGVPIDLVSGETSDHGTGLVPGHLGASLLALGDVDPGPWVAEGVTAIEAMLG